MKKLYSFELTSIKGGGGNGSAQHMGDADG